MNEFDIIEKYFKPLTMGQVGCAGLKDDGAIIDIPADYAMAVSSDTLNEGVHFIEGTAPEDIAKKALRVNLSDLASMGAAPLCYQLNLAFPSHPSDDWLARFSMALHDDNQSYGVFCSGGDTTRIKGDYLSVSITVMGLVPKGKAVRRGGAQDGDAIVITGVIGDAALGLRALQNDLQGYDGAVSRYRVPTPRCDLADIIRQYANAATDISDGFLADCMHIANESGLGAAVNFDVMPFSADVKRALACGDISFDDVVKGGDDYVLIMAVPPQNMPAMMRALKQENVDPFCLGVFTALGKGLILSEKDKDRINMAALGWAHF